MIRKLSLSLFMLFMLVVMIASVSINSQAQSRTLLTRHTREAVLNGNARLVKRLPANQTMHFDVMLALSHQPDLEIFLQEVYDPSSSSYRHFVTVEEFTARFGPSQADYDAVKALAKASGFTVVGGSRNRMDVILSGSVASIEKAFQVTMGVYQHPTENRTFYAPDREPAVDLPFQLWHISGLDNYSIPRPNIVHKSVKAKSNATTGSGPDQSYLGSDMRAAYYGNGPLTGAGQSVGLLEYLGTDLADLETYYANIGQTETVRVTLTSVDGTPVTCLASQGCDDTEQTLDMTQALGMAPGLASLVMYIGSTDSAMFNAMATAKPLSAQLSCSWYWSPADPKALNPIFMEFAAQGQNLFDAAGDSYSWQIGGSIWPADNAYLVSVGGTDLETQSAGGPWASETAWFNGGGGFSPNNIPIPSWQLVAVDQCIDVACSTTLRNGPDVSANSDFTFYVCADQTTCSANEYGGTSFAAPMWAGYLALANQQLLANGSTTTLGFINPILYTIGLGSSYDTDFHDVTVGTNGYSATAGFDLATGWGSPNGSSLITALLGTVVGSGPSAGYSPVSVTFGTKGVGKTTASKKVILTNVGNSTLNISTIITSGDFALKAFTATKKLTPCVNGGTVAAGATCAIEVTFTPTQPGTRSGNVTFTDNASPSTQQVALSGFGRY
ncbi:MAG: protease pro-enzyme activation domain-containing protein [Candidatus Sulfotelmatobacter sp.]